MQKDGEWIPHPAASLAWRREAIRDAVQDWKAEFFRWNVKKEKLLASMNILFKCKLCGKIPAHFAGVSSGL